MKRILVAILAVLLTFSVAFASSADGWKEQYE